ncbi:hypothetical protein glysoja_019289 [Glycine soja]|nr:hypothetical protein glysoja_019289 [Glycine soja]
MTWQNELQIRGDSVLHSIKATDEKWAKRKYIPQVTVFQLSTLTKNIARYPKSQESSK